MILSVFIFSEEATTTTTTTTAATTYDVSTGCQVKCTDVFTTCGATTNGQSCVAKCPDMTSCLTSGGTVWGTNVYTDDSSMCRAAINAGVIPATGGVVEVTKVAGQGSYSSSSDNGVATNTYGSWPGSCSFSAA